MNPRLALALALTAGCALAAVIGVSVAARGGSGGAAADDRGLQLVNGWAGATRPAGIPPADFSLLDQDGKRASLAAYRGRPVVLTFLYSTCEDSCPTQVQAIRGALDDLGADVPVLAISVDPANDTPQRARRFVLEQRMTGRMRFLLGSREELAPLWKAYAIAPQREELEHSAYVLLIDGEGRQRIAFPFGGLTSEGLAHDLRRLGAA